MRFAVLHLQPYGYEEFRQITRRVLYREGGISPANSDIIAEAVWKKMKSANIRDCVRISHMATSIDDIPWVVNTLIKYS
jgi:hypothetical protein